MKCPVCNFISSDKRDICPKCSVDLRPHKEPLGIAISYPDVPADELRRRYRKAAKGKNLQKKKRQSKKADAQKESESSWFSSFLGIGTKKKVRKKRKVKKKKTAPSAAANKTVEAKATPASPETKAKTPEEKPQKPALAPPVEAEASAQQISEIDAALASLETVSEALEEHPPETAESALPEPAAPDVEASQVEEAPAAPQEAQVEDSPQDEQEQTDPSTENAKLDASALRSNIPYVAPDVVDFGDADDDAFEKALDAMLGDETIAIEAVAVETSEDAGETHNADITGLLDDDIEVSFDWSYADDEEDEGIDDVSEETESDDEEETEDESEQANDDANDIESEIEQFLGDTTEGSSSSEISSEEDELDSELEAFLESAEGVTEDIDDANVLAHLLEEVPEADIDVDALESQLTADPESTVEEQPEGLDSEESDETLEQENLPSLKEPPSESDFIEAFTTDDVSEEMILALDLQVVNAEDPPAELPSEEPSDDVGEDDLSALDAYVSSVSDADDLSVISEDETEDDDISAYIDSVGDDEVVEILSTDDEQVEESKVAAEEEDASTLESPVTPDEIEVLETSQAESSEEPEDKTPSLPGRTPEEETIEEQEVVASAEPPEPEVEEQSPDTELEAPETEDVAEVQAAAHEDVPDDDLETADESDAIVAEKEENELSEVEEHDEPADVFDTELPPETISDNPVPSSHVSLSESLEHYSSVMDQGAFVEQLVERLALETNCARSTIEAVLRGEPAVVTPEDSAAPTSDPETPSAPETSGKSIAPPLMPVIEPSAWDTTARELHAIYEEQQDSLELSMAELTTVPVVDGTTILFDLAARELDGAYVAPAYTEDLPDSASRVLETESLEDQVRKLEELIGDETEESLEEAVLALSQGIGGYQEPSQAIIPQRMFIVSDEKPSIARRIGAKCIDVVCAFSIGMLITAILFTPSYARADLLSVESWVSGVNLPFGIVAMLLGFLAMILMNTELVSTQGKTLGKGLLKLRVTSTHDLEIGQSQAFARSCLDVIAVCLLGLPYLLGLHDKLASTTVVAEFNNS